MTGPPLLRLLARLFTLAVAGVAAVYLLVYLYRWEWNRALISGLFLLVAEIAYVGSSIRTEIGGLRARIDALESRVGPDAPGAPAAPAAPSGVPGARPARSFAWLRESASGQMSVFVPVLLGAGVILSGIGFVIERIAGLVVRPPADREVARPPAVRAVARPLLPLDVPPGGLLERTPPGSSAFGDGRSPRRLRGIAVRVIALVVSTLALVAAIDVIAEATQSRPSPRERDAATVVELTVEQRRARPAIEAAEALTVACHGTLHADSEFTEITARGDHQVRLEVRPALSETRRRRLFGCLQDATLDLVQAHVVSWRTDPAPGAPDVS